MNSDGANELGPDWTTTYRGSGMGVMKSDDQRVPWVSPTFQSVSARTVMRNDGVTEFYGSMPNSSGEHGAHDGPIGDCSARCLCDLCPEDTSNDCWCAGFKPVGAAVGR